MLFMASMMIALGWGVILCMKIRTKSDEKPDFDDYEGGQHLANKKRPQKICNPLIIL